MKIIKSYSMEDNIKTIEARIQAACDRAGRNRNEVTLIAVSKTKPDEMVLEAYHFGMRHFGENKVQELVHKYEELQGGFKEPVYWHLIGHLQRNKVKYIVDKTILIHSVDSLRLAEHINEEAEKKDLICDILIEINIADEDTKFGINPKDALNLFMEMSALSHIRVRGLMAIAPYVENPDNNRVYFRKLRELYVDIKTKNNDNMGDGKNLHPNVPNSENRLEYFNILSMGMTGDFEVAIEEGATMVRVGTGIFGERDYSKTV